jgi:signal transduction histidine kinase
VVRTDKRSIYLTSILEKRVCLHKDLADERKKNDVLQMQIGQLQALANIGTTTCMIAHEINNLLTPVSNYAELSLANPKDKELAKKALEKAAQNGQRAAKVMESILAVANGETQEKKKTKLSVLVDEIFSCLCRDFRKDGITVNLEIPEGLEVWGIPVEIQQVLMNLILNARDSMLEGGGVLTIRGCIRGDNTEIEVRDTGCGIERGELAKIFEPFHTTKSCPKSQLQNSGSGLGLAFCKKIIDVHNGSISVESERGGGSSFKITLPNSD